jgi:hypothetical protein
VRRVFCSVLPSTVKLLVFVVWFWTTIALVAEPLSV